MLQNRKLTAAVSVLWAAALWKSVPETNALDNGLAMTPPMGFNNWQRFRCNTDCKNYPDTCISEKLFMTMADAMVARGYLDAGYQYVNIDDCWFADNRDNDTGRLEPNAERFPSGMKALADYIHSKGLKFGLYQDVGNKTCAGFPGLLGYEQVDAQTYAEWGVDYVKVDGCNIDPKKFDVQYPLFGQALNETGRPIVYSCEWPVYQRGRNISTNFTALRETCNLWRNYDDIEDSFDSLKYIMDWMGKNNDLFRSVSGPGGWNDPDMLNVGDYGLSLQQSQAQFALWAILAAPLLISADIRNIRPEFEQILLNKDIIAINQDPLGIMGERIDSGSRNGGVEIWRRPITPTKEGVDLTSYSYALAFWCRGLNGYPIMIEKSLAELGLNNANGYTIKDLYGNASEDTADIYFSEDKLQLFIEPSGGIIMLRATLAKPSSERVAREQRFRYGDVLPYHDSAQLVAKEAWEELQRQSARQQQWEDQQFYPVETDRTDDDGVRIVYPAQQFDVNEYVNRRSAASEWVSRQRIQLEKLRRYVVDHHPFDSKYVLAYLMACCFIAMFSLTVFAIVRTTSAPQSSPKTSGSGNSNGKGLRINGPIGKLAAPTSLSAQIDARRSKQHLEGKTNDVFLPQIHDDEYDDGFDEGNLHNDDANRYVGTVETGQYVRL